MEKEAPQGELICWHSGTGSGSILSQKESPTYERERERERLESVCPTDNEEIVLEEDMVMVIVIEGSSEVYGES